MKLEPQEPPQVSVSAEALLVRKPDIGYLTLFLRADGILLEDAVREVSRKVDDIQGALRETYQEIRHIEVRDAYTGEGRSSGGFPSDKNPPRPEAIKSIVVVIPPNRELAIRILDVACRMGCTMGNPAAPHFGGQSRGAILYGVADPAEAEHETVARAMAQAREKAARIARMADKKIGPVRYVSVMDVFMPEDPIRPNKHIPSRLYSTSPETVEVSAKVSVAFELVD